MASKLEDEVSGYEEEVNDSPVEEVRLTVPITDDPSMPALTFRTWVLGISSCCILSFVNQFFGYRHIRLTVSSLSAQIITLPIGKLMAATLPTKRIRVPLTPWSFSINPGPFNTKEHVLVTIFASEGTGGVLAVTVVTTVKAFFHRDLHPVAAMLLAQTTQLVGLGSAGLFRKYLVDSPYMWWPSNVAQVSLFRALHEKEKRPKGGQTRLQFFMIVFVASFAYYVVPGFLFPSISALSFVCWIWKDSITAQQIGSGLGGLGIGSFTLDWSTISNFLGSPITSPLFATINTLVGFFLFLYVLVPVAYWSNMYEAKRFPILSPNSFDFEGQVYNFNRVINKQTFDLDVVSYNNYSKLYLSVLFAFIYGLNFASLTATISHVALFDGKTIRKMWKKTASSAKDQFGDVHTRLMKKNYAAVPQWWFQSILVFSIGLSLLVCEGFNKELQLPWWGFFLACGISFIFILPIGIVQATTNMEVGLNVITELIIGYLLPGKPLANMTFKTYCCVSTIQALSFLSDFKLGQYMKIPPKSMFIAQLSGTVIASSVTFGTAWWLLTSVENICQVDLLPEGSPWTCPGNDVFFNASIIWGVVGPLRMFTNQGIYPEMNWFFLVGLLAPVPVWLLSRKFPEKKWIRLIHMPMILGGAQAMPSAKPIHYICWGATGIFFNGFVYRWYKGWWLRYSYIFSAAMNAGVAFMALLLYVSLEYNDISGPKWWGEAYDHCPLAKCPTTPGIQVKGCPVH